MTAGRAFGENREYQVLCRDVLQISSSNTLQPYSGDGIDVALSAGGTVWTLDVALRDPVGRLVIAEARRKTSSVEQEEIAAFAHKIELLRKSLQGEVAGYFLTRTGFRSGAVKHGSYEGIQLAVCEQRQPLDGFGLVYHAFDPKRLERISKGEMYSSATLRLSAELANVAIQIVRPSDDQADKPSDGAG